MSIRKALATFFRPSKASVEPVSRTDDPGMWVMLPSGLARIAPDGTVHPVPTAGGPRGLFTDELIADATVRMPPEPDVLVKREHTPFPQDAFEIGVGEYRGISINGGPVEPLPLPKPPQHPLAPEHNPPPLDWGVWTRMARENQRRGWSFCRYAVKFADRMACVFGIVRGPWGICTMNFYICGAGTFDTLHAITHLTSGMGCGLFTDQESAAAACDIAARLADDWETLDPYADPSATRGALDRMHSAWAAAGLTKCATHAHADAGHNTTPIPIWFQDYGTIIAGRPEKLS